MAGITLTQAQSQLDAWLAAMTACAAKQSYEIAGRRLTYANLKEIRETVRFWDAKVKELTTSASGGIGVTFVVPQ